MCPTRGEERYSPPSYFEHFGYSGQPQAPNQAFSAWNTQHFPWLFLPRTSEWRSRGERDPCAQGREIPEAEAGWSHRLLLSPSLGDLPLFTSPLGSPRARPTWPSSLSLLHSTRPCQHAYGQGWEDGHQQGCTAASCCISITGGGLQGGNELESGLITSGAPSPALPAWAFYCFFFTCAHSDRKGWLIKRDLCC